jgi:hypothetical protein
MRLVQACLDKQLVDRHGQKIGRVDGIVLTSAPGARPRVAFVEVGAVTRARRLHPRFARWIAALVRRWQPTREDPWRIPFAAVTVHGIEARVAVDGERTPALAVERWLRRTIVQRIPGA